MIEKESDSSYMCQNRPASTHDTHTHTHTSVRVLVADIPHPCLQSLKNDRKQRKRKKSLFDCRQAPEAVSEHCLANKNKVIHKALTALRAVVFMKKQMAQEERTASLQHL